MNPRTHLTGRTSPGVWGRDDPRWGGRSPTATLERRGQHADGVRVYDTCRRLFTEELECAKAPGIRATLHPAPHRHQRDHPGDRRPLTYRLADA